MKQKLIDLYLDWLNNYLTMSVMSEHYGFEEKEMFTLIEMGRKYHEEHVKLLNLQFLKVEKGEIPS